MGGWAWHPTAAASGRAASIATLVSGRWARGNSGYTIPGLSLTAFPASLLGQVIWGLAGRPEEGLVQGCSREGEEKDRSRVVHSSRGGIQILPEVWKGQLIKPWKFTALQAKWKC